MTRLVRLAIGLAIVAFPAAVLAQAVAPEATGQPLVADWIATLMSVLTSVGGLIAAGMVWLHKHYGAQIKDWLRSKTQNELALAGIRAADQLWRMVNAAVAAGNGALVPAVKAARAPTSPGGEAITREEGQLIKTKVISAMAAANGGWGAIATLVAAAFGGEPSLATAHAWVSDAVEASLEVAKGRTPTTPAA